jgi:sigma-B regulation protein RsbU (phosphoserine phosphatase)
MADVSGKGIGASIVTASLEALAAAPIESGAPPDAICDELCRRLYKRTPPEKYATAFCAVLELATGRLSYTNAGHNTALLAHADGTIEDLTTCGLPIALLPEATYERRETHLEPGAGLLIYTDGITEAENRAGDEFGLDRLRSSYARNFRRAIGEVSEAIQNELAEFVGDVPFPDDRTILLLQRTGPNGASS